jgi:hypothetical protein
MAGVSGYELRRALILLSYYVAALVIGFLIGRYAPF